MKKITTIRIINLINLLLGTIIVILYLLDSFKKNFPIYIPLFVGALSFIYNIIPRYKIIISLLMTLIIIYLYINYFMQIVN